jgi:dUTP pyrophosphatase
MSTNIESIFHLTGGENEPIRGTTDSAGADICALNNVRIEAGKRVILNTGIHLKEPLPSGLFIMIDLRSSLRFKGLTQLGLGIIDSDYLGEIKLVIYNTDVDDYIIKEGDRIAQMVIMKHLTGKFIGAKCTTRGIGGIGSTGT